MELTVDKLKSSQALLIKQLKEQTDSRNKLEVIFLISNNYHLTRCKCKFDKWSIELSIILD